MSDEMTFAVRFNEQPEVYEIKVKTGVYCQAALAAPAICGIDRGGRQDVKVEIWAPKFVGTHHRSFHFLLADDECGNTVLRQIGKDKDGVWRAYRFRMPGGLPLPDEWHPPARQQQAAGGRDASSQ